MSFWEAYITLSSLLPSPSPVIGLAIGRRGSAVSGHRAVAGTPKKYMTVATVEGGADVTMAVATRQT
ncbi:hypothetical protein V6Z11_A07G159700 [Gossypium hirsutum]